MSKSSGRLSSRDRTAFQPSHQGPNVFPNTAFFAVLLRHAHLGRLAIRDDNAGIEKTYAELLADALSLREALKRALPENVLVDIQKRKEVYVGVFAAGSYEYAVAMLGAYAVGAAVVPMTVTSPTREALYFVSKSRQVAILTSAAGYPLGVSTAKALKQSEGIAVPVLDVSKHFCARYPPVESLLLSSDLQLDENGPGLVIFTSGTTGKPKGAVHRRSFFSEDTRATAQHYGFDHRDTILHLLPVHHATGVMVAFLPFLSIGACIEFRSGSFDSAWTWQRWRKGGITVFSGVPTIFTRMMRYYEEHLAKQSEAEQKYFQTAASNLTMLCGSSALPRPIQDFWTGVRGGRLILTRYGSTEVGPILKMDPRDQSTPEGSVGVLAPGADAMISDEGELLIRTPFMFSKYVSDCFPGHGYGPDKCRRLKTVYLYDDKATSDAFNENGYFKTGDIARRQGKHYFILGRAKQDILKSGGYKISALDIEREVLSLPYVNETIVVGVDDEEFGQRVAVVISLRTDQSQYSVTSANGKMLTLDQLRKDLQNGLSRYKLPTLLRVFDGELPKTASGKILKRTLGPQLFPSPGWKDKQEVQAWYPQHRAKL